MNSAFIVQTSVVKITFQLSFSLIVTGVSKNKCYDVLGDAYGPHVFYRCQLCKYNRIS